MQQDTKTYHTHCDHTRCDHTPLRMIVLCCLFIIIGLSTRAQSPAYEDKNPFELPHRLQAQPTSPQLRDSLHTQSGFIPDRSDSDFKRNKSNALWFSPMILLLLGLIVSLNRKTIVSLFRSLFNINYLNLLYRDQHFRYNFQNVLLAFLFVLTFSFFLQQALHYFFSWHLPLWKVIPFITVIYSIRHLLMRLISYAFDDVQLVRLFDYTIFVFNLILGILLVPIVLIISFAPGSMALAALYSGLALCIVFYLYRLLRGFILVGNQLFTNKLRFITYLCALEIAPMLLIVKIIKYLGG